MANKYVYYGSIKNNGANMFFEKVLKNIKGNNYNFYYLLPNGELLSEYRRKFTEETGANLGINLFTFDDIVDEILLDEDYDLVSDEVRLLIIGKVLKELREDKKIKFYAELVGKDGFIKSISTVIGTIKRSLIKVNDFNDRLPNVDSYRELAKIYNRYQDYLEDMGLVDREDLYIMAIDSLKYDSLALNNIEFIIIDQFYDFRPVEIKLIEKLSRSELDIYINMPFNFEGDFQIIDDSLSALGDLGFQLIEDNKKIESGYAQLARSFFSDSRGESDLDVDVSLLTAPNKYLEIKKIFQDIKKEYIEGRALNEMCITLLDDQYKSLVMEIAREEKIPLSIGYRKKLWDNRMIGELLNIIKLAAGIDFKESFLKRIQSKYFNLKEWGRVDEIYILLRKIKFVSLVDLKNSLLDSKEIQLDQKAFKKLIFIIEEIEKEIQTINEGKNIRGINKAIKEILFKYKISQEVLKELEVDTEKFKYMEAFYSGLLMVLEDMEEYSELLGDLGSEVYFELLINGIEDLDVVLNSGNYNGLQVLDLKDNRGFKFSNNYIPGLSQDLYPKIEDRNFFLNERNHKILKDMGLRVMNQNLKLENEIVRFGSIIANTKDRLLVSYSKGEDGSQVESIFIDEIKRILGKNIKSVEIDFDYLLKENLDDLTTRKELELWIIKSIYENKKNIDGIVSEYISNNSDRVEKINKKNFSEKARIEKEKSRYSGFMNSDSISNSLAEKNKGRIYSTSFLELYNKCPFRFFLEKIFDIEDIYEESKDYDPLIIGDIYHRILKVFYEREHENINRDILEGSNIDSTDYYKAFFESFEDIIVDSELKEESSKNQLLIDSIHDNLWKFIELDLARLFKHSIFPWKFEEEFGKEREFKISKDGEEIYLGGIIDRIDKTQEDGTIVIDYKTGSNNYRLKDMEKALSLQLPIYLMAMEDYNVLSGIYGEINSGSFQLGISLTDKSFSAKGIRNNSITDKKEKKKFFNFLVDEIFDIKFNILSGNFIVDPKECPEYCRYKKICRYKNRR